MAIDSKSELSYLFRYKYINRGLILNSVSASACRRFSSRHSRRFWSNASLSSVCPCSVDDGPAAEEESGAVAAGGAVEAVPVLTGGCVAPGAVQAPPMATTSASAAPA